MEGTANVEKRREGMLTGRIMWLPEGLLRREGRTSMFAYSRMFHVILKPHAELPASHEILLNSKNDRIIAVAYSKLRFSDE